MSASPTRREFVASAAGLSGMAVSAAEPPAAKTYLGVLLYSFGLRARAEKGFTDPLAFVEFCHARGAAGIQAPLGVRDAAYAGKLRHRCGELGIYFEGIVRPPADAGDVERFEAEIASAKACGAEVLRTVMLGGRRYETFKEAADFPRFAERAERSLRLAEPVVRKQRVKLAVENHKDFRVEELAGVMKKIDSEFIGVCLDTGNNIALLDDALATARELARWTFTVHLKDMGVEESRDGFLLAEVPLGQGRLDLNSIVATVRKANAKAHFNLEMITRDPLSIPCLTDRYWATLGSVPGRDLARMLAWVRAGERKEPLPRIAKLPPDQQIEVEERHVRESYEYARSAKLI
jgi:sugar phosphate isomerase/epimerase